MKLINVKLIFNIILTLAFLLWAINIFLPEDIQLVIGHYGGGFTTTLIIVVERGIMFIMFEIKKEDIKNKINKK